MYNSSPGGTKPIASKKEAQAPTGPGPPAPAKQQLLLLAASSQPRRGSLPISRTQLRLNIEEAKLKNRPPSTEIYIPSPTSRLQDTPLTLRKFLNTIRPEDSRLIHISLHR